MNKITRYTTKSMVVALLLTGGLPALKADHHGTKGSDTPLRGEQRIKEAVESGKITREEARKRLEAMRKAAGTKKAKGDGQGRSKGGGKEAELKRKYQAAEKEMRAAVEAGKISKEVGRKKLMEIGKELRGEGQGSSGESDRKKQYQAAEKKIWAAVKEGRASKEEGEKRLALLKEKLFGGSDKKDWDDKKGSDGGVEALKRQLEALKRENEGLRKRLEKRKGG